MSSDESTSTQLSVVSSQGSVALQNKLKRHSAKQWEIELIGNFLLSLYHRSLINPQNEWLCKKRDIRQEYEKHLSPQIRKRFKDACGTDNIGALLNHCGFLNNTPRGSHYYQLKSKELFEFRNKELKSRDKRRIRSNGDGNFGSVLENETEQVNLNALEVNYEIDEDSPEHKLEYQGTTMVQRTANYYPTNNSCCICQLHFTTMDSYEEHLQKHNDESDFEYLTELNQFDSPIFRMSYRLCKNSHYFCFNVNTNTENIVIEKIIIVQSRSMFYVHDMRVPYDMPSNGSDKFYADSHLFTLFVEQPIVLISHLKDAEDIRIIEEHHFVRTLEFPKVNFAVKPYRLPSYKVFKPASKLLDYFPPIEVRNALRDDFIYEKLMQTSNEFRDYIRNEKILQPQTIGPTLRTLLHVEDMDTIKEYVNLLQHNVTLRNLGDSYSLRITPKQRVFVENILSTYDDIILTTRKNITADSEDLIRLILTTQEDMKKSDMTIGRIEDINAGRITFRSFSKLDAKRTYTVIFRPSRLTLRYQYRALELLPAVMPYLKKFLFPGPLIPQEPSTISLELYNKSIYTNPEQLQAVRNIAEGPRNDATYIIFGPPGTGKTTTLVESILQVLKRNGTKVLVTASSNSACDELALRLCENLKSYVLDMSRVIVRVYAQSNESRMDSINDLLIENSNLYSREHFYPDVEILHEYRIVVCTMSIVAKLATGKFGRRENGSTLFTHLFIDEVAAATEVEALMPITTALTPKACLIIAGDHKQLGPVLKSKRAEEFRLGQSLMERLLKRECYRVNTDTGHYDRSVQTRLRLNFRSHPQIVNLYSAMYYNHDLEARAKIDDVSLVKNWHNAPSKDYPIIFCSVKGRSKSDKNSFSLYNSEEINIVMDYVKDLMYFGIDGKPVAESDIGIISPYKKQHLRIREELSLRKWYAIETGSVENFQGREKKIIIVSFVRSGTASLGFLESPNRLNVTLSRAKSLLIMVGNAHTLCMNPDFDHIIKECKRHQTLVGDIYNLTSCPEVPWGNSSENVPTLDPLNRDPQQNSKHQGNRANGYNRRGLKNSNKENKNAADNDDEDDKPSTSSTARATRSKAKNNPTDKQRDTGKVNVSNAKDMKKRPINLDTYFDGLPKVPMANTKMTSTMTPNGTNKKESNSPANQKPKNLPKQNGMQPMPPMAQTSQYQQHKGQQMPFYYPTPVQPMPLQYGPGPSATSLLGMPRMMHPMQPNMTHQKPPNMTPQQLHQYNQQVQMQQQLQHHQQQQLQQHQQQQHHQQQQLQQQHRQQHVQQQLQQHQQQQQLMSAAFSSNFKAPSTTAKLPDIVSDKLNKLNLRKDAKQKKKPIKDENNDATSNANNSTKPKEEGLQPTTLKVAENQNLSSHSKEGKTQTAELGSCQNFTSDDANSYYARDDKTIYRPQTQKSVLDATNRMSSSSSKIANPIKANKSMAESKTKNQNQSSSSTKNNNNPMVEKKLAALKHAEFNAPSGAPPSLPSSSSASRATKVSKDKNENPPKKMGAAVNQATANTSALSSKNLDPSSIDSSKPLKMPSNESAMANALPHLAGAFNRSAPTNKNTATISSTTTKAKAAAASLSLSSSTPQTLTSSTTNLSESKQLKTPTNTKEPTTATQLNRSIGKESLYSLYPTVKQSGSSFASASTLHPLTVDGNIYPTISVTKTETHSTPTNSSTTNSSWRSSKPPSSASSTISYTSSALNETAAKDNLYSSTSEFKRNNSPITPTSSSNVTSWRSSKIPSSTSTTTHTSSGLNPTAARENLYSSTSETKRTNSPIPSTSSSNTNSLRSLTTASSTSSALNQTAARENLNSSSSQTIRSNSTLSNGHRPIHEGTAYDSSALNPIAARENVYSFTSQATSSNSTFSNGRRPIYNDNNAYDDGTEAYNYNHFSRPTRNLNYDNASASQRQNSSRNVKSGDSKCTIA